MYSVGIVTYVERFEKWFKPLLKTIKEQKPDIEIIVCINGEHKKQFDQKYLCDILTFISQYKNVYPMVFTSHRSLSKLWNNLLINSTNDIVVRLDDDLTIVNKTFWNQIEFCLHENKHKSFKINGSWSHVVLNRLEVEKVGWFDERFLGGGEEDGDFEWRYAETFKKEFLDCRGFDIYNHWDQVNYDECLVNMKKCNGKRAFFNTKFLKEKYEVDNTNGKQHGIITLDGERSLICKNPTINQYPYENFYWNKKEEL